MSAHAGIQYPQPSRGSRRPYSIDMLVAGCPPEPVVWPAKAGPSAGDDVRGTRWDYRQAKAEQSILDWLGGQRDAMLALLQTLVNTDSGSYDKPGVDAVGGHIREFLDQHGIASEVTAERQIRRRHFRHRRPGFAALRQPADPADGSSRHGLPQGRAVAPAVQDRGRPRLWAGRRRHEGRPRHELLRAWLRSRNSAGRRRRSWRCSPATRRSARRSRGR